MFYCIFISLHVYIDSSVFLEVSRRGAMASLNLPLYECRNDSKVGIKLSKLTNYLSMSFQNS